jgi:hypothetical protein
MSLARRRQTKAAVNGWLQGESRVKMFANHRCRCVETWPCNLWDTGRQVWVAKLCFLHGTLWKKTGETKFACLNLHVK